jgi:hypothetical protein
MLSPTRHLGGRPEARYPHGPFVNPEEAPMSLFPHETARRLRLPRWALAATLAASLPTAGCVVDDGTALSEDDLTNVANTAVKRQSIGNCWVYASIGWVESLVLSNTGNTLNLSESYVSYWHWYEQIAGGTGGTGGGQIAYLENGQIGTGGFFGVAGELMLRYGLMDEGAFIPEEAEAARSDRQAAALTAINNSLKTGALSTTTARKDRALVRAEMDKAWQLKPEVVAKLDQVFGKSVSNNLYKSKTLPAGMRHPRELPVGWVQQSSKKRTVWLDEAIGKPLSSYDFTQRTGTYAWNERYYPSSATARRTFQITAQKALHLKLPVIMTWFVDFAAMGSDKTFKAPPTTPGRQGGHMTVVEDYEIDNVPGYGTLKAGVEVTDPKALEAALDPKATIKFIRIKNSWGSDLAPQDAAEDFKGFHDLFLPYLNGPLKECTGKDPTKACATSRNTSGLLAFVLPPAAFRTGK